MGNNQMKIPRPIGAKFFVVGTIVSHMNCEDAQPHAGHWYPTGETNDQHAVLINACPGIVGMTND